DPGAHRTRAAGGAGCAGERGRLPPGRRRLPGAAGAVDARGRVPVSRLYPVMLDLTGARVLVVGGGEVAARRVAGLLDAGARVTVIAPEMHAELEARAGSSDLTLIRRALEAGDVTGHRVVMAATGRREVNEL